MVISDGSNRNMGHDRMMWTDEQYRKFVKAEVHHIDDCANIVSNQNCLDTSLKQLIWLHLMGLMETWALIND